MIDIKAQRWSVPREHGDIIPCTCNDCEPIYNHGECN